MGEEKIEGRLAGAQNQSKSTPQQPSNTSTTRGFLEWVLIFGNAVMLLFVIDYMITLVQPTFKTYSVTFWLLEKLNESF
jgi:hypothetical protein